MVSADAALPGRAQRPFHLSGTHTVLGTPLEGPWPEGTQVLYVAMGCFWGVERIYWQLPGVVTTAAGYMGGFTPNPTYAEVCTGRTGHAEAVLVAYDPATVTIRDLLAAFWENHDSTTADRQGNDIGTQYRSALYWTTPEQESEARATLEEYQGVLTAAGRGRITTELRSADDAGTFWYAEEEHQQYLDKNPYGYCNHGPNGCALPQR
ncbi:peptide-methionine (S)-S-oxide reductase MsrA [Kribbia dieselivorans]|uniref:peptide-methionine (S)-S-oxide reductase MsrA n=1 Tax=Kribbia dieselivorans TaxID=331526 RepID=UPI001FE1FA4F|nr:peptide-methionine (S)-S-oxide reductase MsrA [Kribbia dieselivorans]